MDWRDRLNRFMYGRYGQDQFSKFLLAVCFVMLILSFFIRIPGLGLLVLLLLGYVYFRMLSRNVTARAADSRVQGENVIFRCPKCSQKIRIPGGKGLVEITCPKCRTKFRKRT